MADHDVTLDQWRRLVRRLGECPWPGPRPLTTAEIEASPHLLVGRVEDRRRLGRDIHGTKLTVFRAESGTGKSSLLAAMATDLEAGRLKVFTVTKWEAQDGPPDADSFLWTQIGGQLPKSLQRRRDRPLVEVLDEEYGGGCVVILDQFEELIRYRAGLHAKVRDWVVDAIVHHRVKVVLSLRSEYAYRLRPLEQAIRSRGMTTFDLEPIVESEHIEEVCVGGPNGVLAEKIHPKVVAAIVEEWGRAREAALVSDRIGLLHLQAVLYSLHQLARGDTVRPKHLAALLGADGSPEHAGALFEAGLRRAFAIKLEHCELACRNDDRRWSKRAVEAPDWRIDRPLAEGTRDVVQRMVGHLSSGGYKLSREVGELMRQTLGRELGVLARAFDSEVAARDRAGALTRGLMSAGGSEPTDVLTATHADLVGRVTTGAAPTPDDDVDWLTVLENTLGPDREVSAGVMMGAAATDVLVEEVRRFAFAVAWLDAADLVRLTPLGDGETMLSLIHDGFSTALETWAETVQRAPGAALTYLTAAIGEDFDWKDGDENGKPWRALTGGAKSRVQANVRWQSCRVSADFTRVVFVNCDFRQTEFAECRFEGVVFVNCLLDGATFCDCTIVGTASAGHEDEGDDERKNAPIFVIDSTPETVATFARYGRVSEPAPHLLSVTSGVPALPISGQGKTHSWRRHQRGLTMYGGRLCSLMVRSCDFVEDGTLALRFVSGSSLDIVEQLHGHVDLFGSAVRGVSVTAPVDSQRSKHDRVTITAEDTILADTWIGPGLVGEAEIVNCRVWKLFNGSHRTGERNAFDVRLSDSQYIGLVNVEEPADLPPIEGMDHRGLGEEDHPAFVREKAEEMAYRSNPGAYRIGQLREAISP